MVSWSTTVMKRPLAMTQMQVVAVKGTKRVSTNIAGSGEKNTTVCSADGS